MARGVRYYHVMPSRVKPPKAPVERYAAIVSLDPAAVADCGIAVRLTYPLPAKPDRGRLPSFDLTYEGSIWNQRFMDELGAFLFKNLHGSDRVLLAVEDCVFGNHTIARSIGVCVGVLENVLTTVGCYDHERDRQWVRAAAWRALAFPVEQRGGQKYCREEWKQAACEAVAGLYGVVVDDNLAEAMLVNDYVAVKLTARWRERP